MRGMQPLRRILIPKLTQSRGKRQNVDPSASTYVPAWREKTSVAQSAALLLLPLPSLRAQAALHGSPKTTEHSGAEQCHHPPKRASEQQWPRLRVKIPRWQPGVMMARCQG